MCPVTISAQPEPIFYGYRFDDGSPVLDSPFNPDGTVEITAIMGGPGADKGSWLGDHVVRLAGAGVGVIMIDTLGDLREMAETLGSRRVTLGPTGPAHVNPFCCDDDVDRGVGLRPVFAILLGDRFTPEAESILALAVAAFYVEHPSPERRMADFVAVLSALDVPGALSAQRDEIADLLAASALTGELRPFFASRSDVPRSLAPGEPLIIDFDPAVFVHGGPVQALSALAALGLARLTAQNTAGFKALLISDLDRLLGSGPATASVAEAFSHVLRSHRQDNLAVTFVLGLHDPVTPGEDIRRSVMRSASSRLIFAGPEQKLRETAALLADDCARPALEDLLLTVLRDPEMTPGRAPFRPAVLVRHGEARALRIRAKTD